MANGRWLSVSLALDLCIMAVPMVMLIPFSTIIVDILIVLNLIQAILIFLMVSYRRKVKVFFLPSILLLSMFFGLLIEIASARLILSRGAAYNGWAIRTVSSMVAVIGETADNVAAFFCLITVFAFLAFMIYIRVERMAEVSENYILNSLPGKQMAIDAAYCSDTLDQDETIAMKEALQKETNLSMYSLAGKSKFFPISLMLLFFIIICIILGGTVIDILFRGKATIDAIGTYIFFSFGSSLLFILPALLLSITAGRIATESVKEKERT